MHITSPLLFVVFFAFQSLVERKHNWKIDASGHLEQQGALALIFCFIIVPAACSEGGAGRRCMTRGLQVPAAPDEELYERKDKIDRPVSS